MSTAFGPKKMPSTFKGKSTELGAGGRAAKLKDEGVPDAVVGAIARSKSAAPGQKFYRPTAKKK